MGIDRDMRGKAQLLMLLFGAVFLLGASISAWIAFKEWRVSNQLTQMGLRAEGEIFDFDYVRAGGKWKNIPLMRFTPSGGQQQVVHVVGTGLGLGTYPVLYLRDDPKVARIDRFETLWLWFSVGCGGALLLGIPGFAMLRKGLRGF